METNLTRTERTIAITAIAAISVFFAMFLKVNNRTHSTSSQFETGSAIDYKMARPEEAYSEYTLDGREIDETFEGLPVKEVKDKLDKKKQDLIAKQNAETKKKEELKKKQVQAAKAQAQQQQVAKQAVEQRNQLAGDRSKSTDSRDAVNSDNSYTSGQYSNNNTPAAKIEDKNANPEAKNKKTFAEWRALLFANPTSENFALFLAAFRKSEVTGEEYYAMAQDLVEQADTKQKGLGLMALRSVPSLASLSQLVHLSTAAIGNYQSYVDQTYLSYLAPQNIGYLSQALGTKDKLLVVKTLTLLNVNLTKFSQGDLDALTDPRNRREGEVATFNMASYRSLVPALAQLLTSPDQELSTLAQQVTSVIQSSNNIAQN
ncbi:hypothetical protein K2P97_04450 [bacterium]|nr:hypothetical protein [bacterium]